MPVDAIGRDVERAVLEPFDEQIVRIPRNVLDLREGLHPVDALGLVAPEAVRIAVRARIHLFVFVGVDIGTGAPILWHGKEFVGHSWAFPCGLYKVEFGGALPARQETGEIGLCPQKSKRSATRRSR